ncbi:MAG: ATP-binding protein, partial [Candidatus Latescibacteria bacterium]|nr:ATP-binding protein [Candidatus Latescibacterota bacterium]
PFQEHVDVIKRNTEMCQYITRSLLDCARMPQPKMQATDLHALLENVVRFIRSIHKKTNIKIETAFQEADAVCWGDVAQLQQVFVNLLVNADQAIDKDGGTIRLRTTESDDGFIVVDVIDNGPGIGVNHIDNIFEPFYTTKSIGGTGLGLPTSRQIVEAHQGSLTLLVSSPDRTIFRVTLPKTRSQPSEPFIQVDMPEQGVSIER